MDYLPEDLSEILPAALYAALDDLSEYGRAEGRGRSESALYVRQYVRDERARAKAELKRRGLPGTRPEDTRTYGVGLASWQRAGACA